MGDSASQGRNGTNVLALFGLVGREEMSVGMDDRPLIAVSASPEASVERCGAAVEGAGGEAWVLLPGHGLGASEVAARAWGVVIGGGTTPGQGTDPDRDSFEAGLLIAALEVNMPVLGIGRGMHALNAVTGGLPGVTAPGHSAAKGDEEETAALHRIFIAPGSKLAAIVGAGGFVRVNSLHGEAIREPQKSPAMLASAYSVEDAVIEAIESPAHDWAIGVQFQPERSGELPRQFERLFQGLVQRASMRRSGV